MKWYIESRKDEDEALFVTERAPHRLSTDMIRYVIKRIARRAGIKESVYPHRARHNFANHLLNRGASLDEVRDQMGHCKIETTRIYCQLSGSRRKEIHNRYF